jgi:hypothetical protein
MLTVKNFTSPIISFITTTLLGIVDQAENGKATKSLKEFVNIGDILVKINGRLLEDTTLVEVATWIKVMKENSINRKFLFLKPRQVSLETFLRQGIIIYIIIIIIIIIRVLRIY